MHIHLDSQRTSVGVCSDRLTVYNLLSMLVMFDSNYSIGYSQSDSASVATAFASAAMNEPDLKISLASTLIGISAS